MGALAKPTSGGVKDLQKSNRKLEGRKWAKAYHRYGGQPGTAGGGQTVCVQDHFGLAFTGEGWLSPGSGQREKNGPINGGGLGARGLDHRRRDLACGNLGTREERSHLEDCRKEMGTPHGGGESGVGGTSNFQQSKAKLKAE